MVEFLSIQDAQRVREHLDGRRIYDGSCQLRIEFAYERVFRLRVTRNDDDTWDFSENFKPPDDEANNNHYYHLTRSRGLKRGFPHEEQGLLRKYHR